MSTKSNTKSRSARARGRAADEVLMDVRLQRRHVRDGLLSQEELARHIKALPDVSTKLALAGAEPEEDGEAGA